MKRGEPHYVAPDVDCGGGVSGGYWREFRIISDGSCVIGIGATREQAVADADDAQQKREEYLAKPDLERLKILLAKPELLMKEMNEAIQIIGKKILGDK